MGDATYRYRARGVGKGIGIDSLIGSLSTAFLDRAGQRVASFHCE